jgi:hypothetical protein
MTTDLVSRFRRRKHPAEGIRAMNGKPKQAHGAANAGRRLQSPARVRVLFEVGAVASAAGLAFALLIFDVPARQRAEVANAQATDSCAAIYDRGACECALRASDDASGDLPRAPATSASAAQSVSIEGLRARRMNAFVHIVQACMAHGDGAPLD